MRQYNLNFRLLVWNLAAFSSKADTSRDSKAATVAAATAVAVAAATAGLGTGAALRAKRTTSPQKRTASRLAYLFRLLFKLFLHAPFSRGGYTRRLWLAHGAPYETTLP